MVCSVFLLKMVAKPFLWRLPKYGRTKNSKHSKRVPACDFSYFQVPCPKMKNACWDVSSVNKVDTTLNKNGGTLWRTEREISK